MDAAVTEENVVGGRSCGGLRLKAGRDHHHDLLYVHEVWHHSRYRATVKTEYTSEVHSEVGRLCTNKKQYKSNQVHRLQNILCSLLSLLALLPRSQLLHLPPSHPPPSSPLLPLALVLSGGIRLNEGNPTTSLFQKTARGIQWFNESGIDVCVSKPQLWRQSPRDCVCVCLCMHVWRGLPVTSGVLVILFESCSNFTRGVCVYAGTGASLMCECMWGETCDSQRGRLLLWTDFNQSFHPCESFANLLT